MIDGIGTDIIEIDRIRDVFIRFKQRFLQRVFTLDEQKYCLSHKDPAVHLAGRFAAKEAVSKALGTGFREKLSWLDVEILNDSLGKPEVFLNEKLDNHLNNSTILLSISHCKHYSVATAVWMKKGTKC